MGAVSTEVRHWFRHDVRDRIEQTAGGPARLRVILLLAGVLGLSTADSATVGAIAAELERSLHLSNTDVGLLVTVSTGIGAITTLPVGVLTDRVNRTRLLWVSVLIWSAAMIASGFAVSFAMLLISRLALGAVVATAYPAAASLTGDLFPPAERGRVYGYILTGELVGTAVGFLVSGDLAGVLSWRAGFFWLAIPSLFLAWAIRRYLPEPARGGQSRLREGATHIPSVDEVGDQPAPGDDADGDGTWQEGEVERRIQEQQVAPHERLVLHEDPTDRSLWWAVRYTLSIRTNLILIVASGLGYFFLQGLETFAVVYLRGRYGLSQSTASTLLVVLGVGSIVGVLVTGWLSDRFIRRGYITARPVVCGASFLFGAALLLPGILVSPLFVAAPLLFLGAAGLGGTNAPLNAARLDLVHSRLWGRAESVRTALSTALQAIAPLLFGYVSGLFGGQNGGLGQPAQNQPGGDTGLEPTFLIMIIPLVIAGLLLLIRARSTYSRDVASAVASEHATHRQHTPQRP
ncbi:MAG: MFS transporter [Pseudonocardiaceae bacterium]